MNSLVKKTLKSVYNAFRRRLDEHKVFRYAKRYLKKGIYYFPFEKNEIRIIDRDAIKIKNILHFKVNTGGGVTLVLHMA